MTAVAVPPPPEDQFAGAVRAAIGDSGLTLRQVERKLKRYGVLSSSIATLSDWGSGRFHPNPGDQGRGRVLALERVLRQPAGDLLLLLPSTPTTYPARPQQSRSRDPLTRRRDDLLAKVGRLVGPQKVIAVAHRKEYALGDLIKPVLMIVTTTVRALHDGVDRYLYVHAPDRRLHSFVLPGAGCAGHTGHVEPVPATDLPMRMPDPLVVEELRFGRPLLRGETHTFTFTIGYATEDRAPVFAQPLFRHVQLEPCERLELRLSVHPPSYPADLRECRWLRPRDLERDEHAVPVARPGLPRYEQRHTDPVPGGYGWRWRPLSPPEFHRRGGTSAA